MKLRLPDLSPDKIAATSDDEITALAKKDSRSALRALADAETLEDCRLVMANFLRSVSRAYTRDKVVAGAMVLIVSDGDPRAIAAMVAVARSVMAGPAADGSEELCSFLRDLRKILDGDADHKFLGHCQSRAANLA